MTVNRFTYTLAAQSSTPAWMAAADTTFKWIALTGPAATTPSVVPSPMPLGVGGVANVVDAWCGACLVPTGSHYLLHGGGHGDYAGNEVYALQLALDAPLWQRIWGPTPNAQITVGTETYADGNPAAMHSGYAMVWDAVSNRMVRAWGAPYQEPSGFNGLMSSFDWTTKTWNPIGTHPSRHPDTSGGWCSTCITTAGDIYTWRNSKCSKYTKGTNSWTLVAGFENIQSLGAGVFDPVRNVFWAIGGNAASGVGPNLIRKWDIASNVRSTVTVTGTGTSILNTDSLAAEYDSTNDCIWVLSKAAVYRFSPAALTFNTQATTGATLPVPVYGPFDRARYVPELKGIVYQPTWASSTYFMRTT